VALNGKIQSEKRARSTARQSIGHEMIPAPTVVVGIDGAVRRRCRFIGICSECRVG
jgi:hypothetical protein